jgi:initiation factor 1A
MVKNTNGGNKAKGQARKFVSVKPRDTLRFSTCELELYAKILKMLGNGMCHVLCSDGTTRLCHIRGKFSGRGKKDNFIKENNSVVLVGLREWEVNNTNKTKMENCDLLEVYNDVEKERLRNLDRTINWNMFLATENKAGTTEVSDIEFTDSKTDEYNNIIETQLSQKATTTIHLADDEEIDIDDI